MSKGYSRLLVLVEDTSATSRLWPSWQRHSLEPLLRFITEGHFGVYELCLVAFSSTDGQSNALFQKTSWTTNPAKFRRQLGALKFEGICGGHALAEALSEAVYLSQQSSNLTDIQNFTQHILVCATDSVGRSPLLWPHAPPQSYDKIHALKILRNLGQFGLTVSFLIEPNTDDVLTQSFAAIAGSPALKFCQEKCKGKEVLSLIHPSWKHGFAVHFQPPNLKQKEQEKSAISSVDSHSSSSAKTALMVQTVDPQEPSKQEVEDGPVFQSEHFQEQVLQNSSAGSRTGQFSTTLEPALMQDPLTGAVDLTEDWEMEEDRPDQQELGVSPMEVEFDMEEEELLGLRSGFTTTSTEQLKIENSERKRKIKDTVDCTGPIGLTAQQNKVQTGDLISDLMDQETTAGRGVGFPALQNQRPGGSLLRSGVFCGNNKTFFSTTGPISIENTGPAFRHDADFFSSRNTVEGSQIEVVSPYDDSVSSSHKRLASSSFLYPSPSSYSALTLIDPKQQQPQGQMYSNKKSRTQQWPSLPSMHLPTAPVHQTRLTNNKHVHPVVLWKGPLYYADSGPGSRLNGPKKLFDMEVLKTGGDRSGRLLDFPNLTGQTEMIVRNLCPRDQPKCSTFCMIGIEESSMTSFGHFLLMSLVTRNCAAVIDLISSEVRHLVILAERSPNGGIRFLAGF